MRESIKSVLALVLIISMVAAGLGWMIPNPDLPVGVVLAMKYGGAFVALITLALLVKMMTKKDDVPDFLSKYFTNYYNRDGFCFTFEPIAINGICFFEIYFQNQYANRCIGCIALRPARGFFLGRAEIEPILMKIECGPAEFGVVRVAVAIPRAVPIQM